jgi:hypothetical protein
MSIESNEENPILKKYPVLKLNNNTEQRGKCLKNKIINIFVSDPISQINSMIKFEIDMISKINSAKTKFQTEETICYLCNNPFQRGVDAIVECEESNCHHVSHVHCNVFDKYLECRTVQIEDNLNHDIPIIRFNECIFESPTLKKFKSNERKKAKKKKNERKILFNETKTMDFISALICLKFDDSINTKEILENTLKEIVEIGFNENQELLAVVSQKIKDWFSFTDLPMEFKFSGMIKQDLYNSLIEMILKEIYFFNFPKLKKNLDLPNINMNFQNYLATFIDQKGRNIIIKKQKNRIESPTSNPSSKKEKPVFNKPDIRRNKNKELEEKTFTSKEITYCFAFELNQNLKNDLLDLFKNKEHKQGNKTLSFKKYLFPFQANLFSEFTSLSILKDFFQVNNLNNKLSPAAPTFKGLCIQHYNK